MFKYFTFLPVLQKLETLFFIIISKNIIQITVFDGILIFVNLYKLIRHVSLTF